MEVRVVFLSGELATNSVSWFSEGLLSLLFLPFCGRSLPEQAPSNRVAVARAARKNAFVVFMLCSLFFKTFVKVGLVVPRAVAASSYGHELVFVA